MGDRGSKSSKVREQRKEVKEQRVDGSTIMEGIIGRCTLVAGKAGSWEKGSNLRLK